MIKTLSRVLGKSDDDQAEPTHSIHVHVERRSNGTTIGITHMNGEELVEADDIRYSPENYEASGLGITAPDWRVNGYKLGLAVAINYLQTKQSGLDKVWIVLNDPEIVSYAKHQLAQDAKKGFAGKDQLTRRAWEVVAQECRRRDIRFREQDDLPGDTSANIDFITRLQKPASAGEAAPPAAEAPPSAQAIVVPLRPSVPRVEPVEQTSEALVTPPVVARSEPAGPIVSAPDSPAAATAWSAWDETTGVTVGAEESASASLPETKVPPPELPASAAEVVATAADPFTAAAEGRATERERPSAVTATAPAEARTTAARPGSEPSAEDETAMLSSAKPSTNATAPHPGVASDSASARSNKDPQEVTRLLFELMLRTATEMQTTGEFRVDALKMIEWEALIAKSQIHLNEIGRRIDN